MGYSAENAIKTKFDHAYNMISPVEYLKEMRSLDYQIPENSKTILNFLIEEKKQCTGKDVIKILDIGCSYGILSAIIKFNLDLEVLYNKYNQKGMDQGRLDDGWFRNLPCRKDVEFHGIDTSANAIEYSISSGFIESGLAVNLELEETVQSGELPDDVDIIVSTGCIGYITEITLGKLAEYYKQERPWIASFVLQIFNFEPIGDALRRYNYTSVYLDQRKFRQRKFKNQDEKTSVTRILSKRAETSSEKERFLLDEFMCADFYLSQPSGEAKSNVFSVFT